MPQGINPKALKARILEERGARTMHQARKVLSGSFISLLCCFSFLAAQPVHAAAKGDTPRHAATGELKAIEQDNIVEIDESRYRLDKNVLVVDSQDKPISVQQLRLPAPVFFEYSYQQQSAGIMAPVIVFIRESRKSGEDVQ